MLRRNLKACVRLWKEARKPCHRVRCHNIKPDRQEYIRGQEMVVKGIADRATNRLLGAKLVGFSGVDKRIDVFVTALSFKAKAEDLFHLDLAYASPFSTTKDPVMYTGMILENALCRDKPLITAADLIALETSGEPYTLVDARASAQYADRHVPGAVNIPQERFRAAADTLTLGAPGITYCNKGTTGNAAQNILLGKGFRRVYNLSGGKMQYRMTPRALQTKQR